MTPAEVARAVVRAVKKHLPFPHYRVFYFGSRAMGKARLRSDYDIGIAADQEVPGDVMVRIQDELEGLPLLQKLDLVDFALLTPEFKRAALSRIKVLYER